MNQQNETMIETRTTIPALLQMSLIRKHFLPLAERTIYRMISEGRFPKADIVDGRKIRLWKRETIEAFIDGWAARNSD